MERQEIPVDWVLVDDSHMVTNLEISQKWANEGFSRLLLTQSLGFLIVYTVTYLVKFQKIFSELPSHVQQPLKSAGYAK